MTRPRSTQDTITRETGTGAYAKSKREGPRKTALRYRRSRRQRRSTTRRERCVTRTLVTRRRRPSRGRTGSRSARPPLTLVEPRLPILLLPKRDPDPVSRRSESSKSLLPLPASIRNIAMPLIPYSMRRTPVLALVIGAFVTLTLLLTHSRATDRFTFLSVLLFDDGYPKISSEYASYIPTISRAHSNASLTSSERELQTRLRALLDAPLLDYPTALRRNEARDACPKAPADRQAIRDQLRMHSKYWATLRAGELARKRMGIVRYLEDIVAAGGDVIGRPGGGRGIVMTGGNKVCCTHRSKHFLC